MINAKELTRLLADVTRSAADHRETHISARQALCESPGFERAAQISLTVSVMDYRKAVSRLFKAVLGRCPEQSELDVIDPAFELRKE